jgi:hypothetical protein
MICETNGVREIKKRRKRLSRKYFFLYWSEVDGALTIILSIPIAMGICAFEFKFV